MAYTLIRELLEPVWIINEVYTISYSSWGENVFQLVQKKKRRGLNKLRRFASGFVSACLLLLDTLDTARFDPMNAQTFADNLPAFSRIL